MSSSKWDRQVDESHPPKRDPLRSNRIAILGVTATTVWTVVTGVAKLPELAMHGAAVGFGMITVWELLKSDKEDREKDD